MNEKHQETLKTKNVKRKLLSVNFDRCVRVTTIPHVKDFTKDEIKSVWYTQAEYDQTREDCFNIVRRMNRAEANTSGPDHPSSYLKARVAAWSTRGLESLGKAKGNIRRVRRLVATKAVLSEQHFQREEGSDDPDFISHLYQQISAPCQIEAHSIGLQDQNEAIQCYKVPVLSHRSTVHVSRLQRPSSCDRLARSY
jgi:hypothetical protein